MDPSATLAEITTLIADYHAGRRIDTCRLGELADALGQWINRGGYLPDPNQGQLLHPGRDLQPV